MFPRLLPVLPLLTLVLFLCVAAYAQEESFVSEASADNFFGIGGRAVGMSEAVVVSTKDGTAIVYNPAALTKIRRPEFYGALSHEKFTNKTVAAHAYSAENNLSRTRLGSLNLTVPVPTYRGALVVAFGVNRTRSFDRTFTFDSPLLDNSQHAVEEESGGIREWSAAAAIELSARISAGLTLTYFNGGEDYYWNYQQSSLSSDLEYIDNIEDNYSAVGLRLGALADLTQNLSAALTIDVPTKYKVEQNYIQRTIENGSEDTEVGYYEYHLTHPFVFNGGLAFRTRTFLIEGNVGYTDWTQLEYDGDFDLEDLNRDLRNSYDEAINFRFGAEYTFPQYGLIVRGGYKHDPLPFSGFFASNQIEKDRNSFSFGLSYLIDRVAMLDVGFARASYELDNRTLDLAQEFTSSKLMFSVAYRI